jgi:hypothetical protein
VPGLPVDFSYQTTRQIATVAPLRPAADHQPDIWHRLFDGETAGDLDGPGEQYSRAG